MSAENIKDTQSNSPLIEGIKEETITVLKVNFRLYIFIIIVIIGNVLMIYKNVNIIIFFLCDIIFIPFIFCSLFLPVGLHFRFDYTNKEIIVHKLTEIKCLGKCFHESKNIAFSEITNFDIQTYWYFNKKNYNLGYYDKNMQFQTLITGQDPTMEEEFSPQLREIPEKLNSLLKGEIV